MLPFYLADFSCPCRRFVPRCDGHAEEAQFLRGGEAGSAGGSTRDSCPLREETAELGQQGHTQSNGYHVKGNKGSGIPQEMAMRGGHYPSPSSGYPALAPGNAGHSQPTAAKYAGTAAPLGVQHSIPL